MELQHRLDLPWQPNQKPPSFKEVMEELGPVPSLIFRAIEFGTAKNHSYCDDLCDGEQPKPHIREAIVRHQARRFLEANNIAVTDEEPLTMQYEPLVALVLTYKNICIRVLKGKRGVVPGCGRSKARRRFYNQRPSLLRLDDGTVFESKWNLLFLWDFDAAFNVSKVWLVFPIQGGSKPADVRYWLHEEIKHPATSTPVQYPEPATAVNPDDELRRLLTDSESAEEDEREKGHSAGA